MKTNKALKGVKKTATSVFSSLFVLVLVAAPSVLHSHFGVGISPVLSGSMRPFSQPGDAFLTVNTTASDLKIGDIVTLHAEGTEKYFAHRIIEIRYQSGLLRIVTKGDANQIAEQDPYMVSPTDVVPRTVSNVKYLGKVLVYMTSIQGRQAGLALIVFANVIGLLYFLFRKKIKLVISTAEIVYKGLFAESNQVVELERRKAQVYRDLYQNAHGELQLSNKEN
jgi:signal peptidase I